MKETLKLGLVLLLFTAVSAGILAATNNITAPIIAEYEREASFAAFAAMFEDADDFQEIEEGLMTEINGAYSGVVEAHEALKGGSVIGYALKTIAGGYGGDIVTVAGINMDGTMAGIKVVSNSETPNLGTVIEEDFFTDSFIGKTVAEALKAVAAPAAENEVQLLSGATVSTGGVVTAVNNAREAFIEFLSDGTIEVAEEEDPMEAIFPEAEEFKAVEDSLLNEVTASHDKVKEVYEALAGGEVVGYIFATETDGYSNAKMPMTYYTGINKEGIVEGVRLGENGETPGLGTIIGEDEFTSRFIGKSTADTIKVDTMSGATESSDGAISGVNKAREAFLEFFSN